MEDADRRPSPVGGDEEKLDPLSGWRTLEVAHGLVVPDLDKFLGISGDGVSDALDFADIDLLLVLQSHLLGRLVKTDARAERDDPALERARNQAAVQIQPLRDGRPSSLARSAVVVRAGNGQCEPSDHDHRRGEGAFARAVAVSGETVLVSASTGPRGRKATLYRKPLDGETEFERCRDGLPWFDDNIDTACVAADGSLVVFGTDDGRVFRSLDGGAHWGSVTKGLPTITAVTIG